ncbi:hypothetical protein EAF00_003458 [Botryotinia globosa]|nr:hypothetical protein EAF00_003458 [Botryotinia globosa]
MIESTLGKCPPCNWSSSGSSSSRRQMLSHDDANIRKPRFSSVHGIQQRALPYTRWLDRKRRQRKFLLPLEAALQVAVACTKLTQTATKSPLSSLVPRPSSRYGDCVKTIMYIMQALSTVCMAEHVSKARGLIRW